MLAALVTVLGLSTTFAAPPAEARSVTYNLDIPAQSLDSALQAFALMSHHRLLYKSVLVEGQMAPTLKGDFTTEEAMKTLLSNAPQLTFDVTPSAVVLIRPKADKSAATSITDAGGSADTARPGKGGAAQEGEEKKSPKGDRFRLAQATAGIPELQAPEQANQGASLEQVVVTAQKRSERIQDVPISIVALNAEELQQREILSMDDLAFAVPDLSMVSGGFQRTIQIRGISNANGTSSLVGVYLDEAAVTSNPLYQLNLSAIDLERVEVLRGPQGTLYGVGSTGGTIRFITKNPDLVNFGVASDVAASFTESGASSQRIDEVVNVPLIENTLGIRVAGIFDHEGGWIDQPAADVKNFNEGNLTDVRLKGLWTPAADLSVTAMANIHRNNGSINNGEDAQGNFTQVFGLTTTPSLVENFDIYNLTISYDLPFARLLTTTTYADQYQDVKHNGYFLAESPPPAPPYDVYLNPYQSTNKNLSEELRLSSTGTTRWQWTIGGFYQHNRNDGYEAYNFGLPGPLPEPAYPSWSSSLSESWAIFGDTSYKLADRLTVGVGLRYFKDHQDAYNNPPPSAQTATFHAASPRIYTQYQVTELANVYASAAKGFRSGGFNSQGQPPFGPESVWTYELGTKLWSRQNRFNVDLSVFYSDYTNFQVLGTPPPPALPENIFSNAGSAYIEGFDLALTAHPTDEWTFSLGGNYLKTRFYKVNATQSQYNVGDPLDLVPKYTFSASAQRDFKWGQRSGFVRMDYSQQGRETSRNRDVGPWFFNESDVITMLNLNATLRVSHHVEMSFLGRNLLNERGFSDPYSYQGSAARPRPRTYGIEISMSL